MDRRDFFRDLVRGVLAAGLVVGGGVLWWRKGDDGCGFSHPCGGCKLNQECQLPKRILGDKE